MITYRYIYKSRVMTSSYSSLMHALRVVAKDVNSGTKIPLELVTENKRYIQQDILLLCRQYGVL
jgi:hypothetical protein